MAARTGRGYTSSGKADILLSARKAFAATLVMLLVTAAAAEEAKDPEVRFQLDGGADKEVLMWISGWAFAADEILGPEEGSAEAAPMCVPPGYRLSSQELLEILNARFAGVRVSSKEASAALLAGLRERHSCEESSPADAPPAEKAPGR